MLDYKQLKSVFLLDKLLFCVVAPSFVVTRMGSQVNLSNKLAISHLVYDCKDNDNIFITQVFGSKK